ncbi:MAG: intradiol ring-cleavage dioxygenase [Solirubrobacterales bacterium]
MSFDKTCNRREALAGIGTVSLGALLAACGSDDEASSTSASVSTEAGETALVEPRSGKDLASLFDETSSCTLTAEGTEGPYYFDVDKIRTDIREDREGTPLRLVMRVRDSESCEALANAVVDIWHCDAGGIYSGFEEQSIEAGGTPEASANTGPGTFLRGAQVTNRDGIVEMTTIYPGWYQGRTVHIHAKVHLDNSTVLTTQFYFDDAVSSGVYAEGDPYRLDDDRQVFNDSDGTFDASLVLTLSEEDGGFLGTISFDVAQA